MCSIQLIDRVSLYWDLKIGVVIHKNGKFLEILGGVGREAIEKFPFECTMYKSIIQN